MRLVPRVKREAMMTFIRDLLSDKDFCPFYFQFSFARVLSGEEEAAFAWTGSNYLFNTLFPVPLLTSTSCVLPDMSVESATN